MHCAVFDSQTKVISYMNNTHQINDNNQSQWDVVNFLLHSLVLPCHKTKAQKEVLFYIKTYVSQSSP